jgi:hypothetical protein
MQQHKRSHTMINLFPFHGYKDGSIYENQYCNTNKMKDKKIT